MIGLARDWLLVSETFVTIQGEGPSCGQRALFIRLGGCNQHCSWCDTPYTWAFDTRHAELHQARVQYSPSKELRRMSLVEAAARIFGSGCTLIVITGGEPMLQVGPIAQLISAVNESLTPFRFEIETAGTVHPADLLMFENVSFNVSPKLASSGNELKLRRNTAALKAYAVQPQARFKFVISEETLEDDISEVQELQRLAGIDDSKVWLMPCGTDKYEILIGMQSLSAIAITHGWNLSTRLHVLIWGNERGR